MTESLYPDRRTAAEIARQQKRTADALEKMADNMAYVASLLTAFLTAGQDREGPPTTPDGEAAQWRIDVWNQDRGVKVHAFAHDTPLESGARITIDGTHHVVTRTSSNASRMFQRVWVTPEGAGE